MCTAMMALRRAAAASFPTAQWHKPSSVSMDTGMLSSSSSLCLVSTKPDKLLVFRAAKFIFNRPNYTCLVFALQHFKETFSSSVNPKSIIRRFRSKITFNRDVQSSTEWAGGDISDKINDVRLCNSPRSEKNFDDVEKRIYNHIKHGIL